MNGVQSLLSVRRDDFFVLNEYSTISATIRATIRLMTKDGLIDVSLPCITNGTMAGQVVRIRSNYEGEIIFASVAILAGTVVKGQILTNLSLTVGEDNHYDLCYGYLYAFHNLVFTPSSAVHEGPLDGEGAIDNYDGLDPVAGAEVLVTVPAHLRWHVKSIRVPLVTSAVANDRTVEIGIHDGTNYIERRVFGAVQAASLTRTYEAIFGEKPDEAAFDVENTIRVYFPPKLSKMKYGWNIRTATANLDATAVTGDNYGIPRVNLERWIEP